MTIAEMHLAFRLQLDKSGSLELPSFEPEEIDFWLNSAIRKFVRTKFSGSNKGLGFEGHLVRTEDLKSLVVDTSTIPVANNKKPYLFIATPIFTDKWFILGEEVEISYTKLGDTTLSTKRQGVTICTVDTYTSHINDPYSEHILHYEEAKPLRLVYQNTIELVADVNYTITNYYVRYLKRPALVSITTPVISCDLPEHTHDEIVALATSMVLENIEQPRYQTQLNELNKIE